MNTKTFSNGLTVSYRKSAVIFEADLDRGKRFPFSPDEFAEFAAYIEAAAANSWENVDVRIAYSFGSDYDEYYDRELDNNGYLSFEAGGLYIDRPYAEHRRLYKFNKTKMGTFLYDLREKLGGYHEAKQRG